MIANDEIIKLIFGFKIKYLRSEKKLSYQQLSNATGLAVSYLHDIEGGKKYPKVDKINALAGALDVTYDELVSTRASKKMQPIIDLLQSDFFKIFPLDVFGISPATLLELFSSTPDKVTAFISTVSKIARNYQMKSEHFYMAALRSYQDMYDNYFSELEQAVATFQAQYDITPQTQFQPAYLETLLEKHFGVRVDRQALMQHEPLKQVRSYYAAKKSLLFLNKNLSTAQENFLLGRELAFQYLKFKERPFLTRAESVNTFDILLNNFKASYFSAALLMNEGELVQDIRQFAQLPQWQPETFSGFLDKYNVTAEMFLQRLTNLLPHHFGIHDLFFIRMQSDNNFARFQMTKELHLSRLHSPYANERDEHYCRRWVSINIIKQLPFQTSVPLLVDAQISHYWGTDNQYLCLAFAHANSMGRQSVSSVTIGLLVTDKLRQLFRFLGDANLPIRHVNTTCERCAMPGCEARVAPPTWFEQANETAKIFEAIAVLEQ